MADPRLWMLGCKDGAEGEIMVSILNKYIAQVRSTQQLYSILSTFHRLQAEQGNRLGIMSAVCTGKG
jgi:hypothetical protein